MTEPHGATRIRILVADDHPIVREGLVAVLSSQPDFEVVGEAANGAEAVARAMALRPDVLLLDLAMPELDGVQVLERLREASCAARAIVFTAFDTDERILGAVRAGAQGYLLKGVPRDDIFRAVRTVYAGGSLLTPVVASRLLRHLEADAATPEPPAARLTPRERDVLRLLAEGRPNKEIAALLGIRPRTVKFHASALYQKLDASNRTEAVGAALRHGLIMLAPHADAPAPSPTR